MKKVSKKVTDLDQFGIDIKLTIDGDTQHKSFLGGSTSLVMFAALLAYAIVLFLNLTKYQETTYSVET